MLLLSGIETLTIWCILVPSAEIEGAKQQTFCKDRAGGNVDKGQVFLLFR